MGKPYQLQSDTLAIRTGTGGELVAITIRSGETVIVPDNRLALMRLVDVEWNGETMSMFADDLQGHAQSNAKRPEQVLIERSVHLARSNEELEQFAFAVAHDLREPLRSIEAMTQLFLERNQGKLDGDSAHLLDFVVSNAERMKRLINDLLEFATVTYQAVTSEVDSQAVAEFAVQQLQESVERSGAKIVIEPLPSVRANEEQLLRIFQNLIGNAIKYAGKATPEIRIAASSIDSVVVFSVKDNGIGIDPKHHERIFDPFLRVHKSAQDEGRGIGLTTCKRIVEQYKGRIWVESKLGQGSIFYFTLPVAASDDKGVRPGPNKHGPGDQSHATGR